MPNATLKSGSSAPLDSKGTKCSQLTVVGYHQKLCRTTRAFLSWVVLLTTKKSSPNRNRNMPQRYKQSSQLLSCLLWFYKINAKTHRKHDKIWFKIVVKLTGCCQDHWKNCRTTRSSELVVLWTTAPKSFCQTLRSNSTRNKGSKWGCPLEYIPCQQGQIQELNKEWVWDVQGFAPKIFWHI